MPPHPASFRLAAPAFVFAVATLAGPVAGFAAAPPRPAAPALATQPSATGDAAEAAAALAEAQGRAARAAAAAEDLKRALAPGHLTELMPETDRAFGLASLRSDYADAQRQAAGYRATLGDRHPTLVATEQLMEDLRTQLLDATRKALASAERDGATARADVAAAERRLDTATSARTEAAASRARLPEPPVADATASIAAPLHPPARLTSPLSLPPAGAASDRPTHEAKPPTRTAAPTYPSLREMALALAALIAAALLAAWAGLRLLRSLRPRTAAAPTRRVEPALSTVAPAEPVHEAPEAPAAPAEAVPVLQRLMLPGSADMLAGDARVAADLHATLRAAFGETAETRMTVLVAPAAGLADRDADAAALALALAAAAAGRRPLLMEARAAGRLRGAFVPAGAAPMLIEAGGTARTLYRLESREAPVDLLPSDAGEAEAAAAAGSRGDTARLRGLDAFDTVILVGDDPVALAASADLLLIAAPVAASQAALVEAARPLGAAGRPCGAVLIEETPAVDAGLAVPAASLPRRRHTSAAAPAVRLGLRGSIEPSRRRVGG